jgi:hypothetical protein
MIYAEKKQELCDAAKPVVRQGRKTTGLLGEKAGLLESFVSFDSSISTVLKKL